MPLDFPSDPVDGQVYANFYYSASTGAWNSLGSSNLPSLLRNVTLSTSSASAVPVTVQGAASQSSNLQEWKNSSGTVLSSVNASGVPTFPGGTFTSPASIQNAGITILVLGGNNANGGIEIGRVDGVASTPYIDFHAGANATDHDVRLIAQSGTGVVGSGTLQIYAGQLNLPTKTYAPGSVVQVVSTTYTGGEISNTTSTYVDTNVTATITPKFSSSKLLIQVEGNILKNATSASNACQVRILRDGNVLKTVTAMYVTSTTVENGGPYAITYLDDATNTSATTYKTQFANALNSSVIVHGRGHNGTMTIFEIAQ